jgi:hypothetical protein
VSIAFGGQGVASGIPEHMDVDRERQLGGLTRPLDHPGDSHASKGLTALIDEDIG